MLFFYRRRRRLMASSTSDGVFNPSLGPSLVANFRSSDGYLVSSRGESADDHSDEALCTHYVRQFRLFVLM
jgi:hypothetical protein